MLSAVVIIATFLCGGVAYGNNAHLDPTFGTGGKLLIPEVSDGTPRTEPLPDGRLLIIEKREMLALLPSGQIDAAFGEGGVATLQTPPKGSANIGTVLVDKQGRLLVVTSCQIPNDSEQGRWPSQDQPYQVLVERFTANGRLDLSFGGGDGMVLTDFDLPPAEPGLIPGVFAGPAAIDAGGRILIAGSRAAGFFESKQGPRRSSEPYVGRLTPDGEVDASFAGGGAILIPGLGWNLGLAADELGNAFVAYQENLRVSLARFTADGRLDPGFGENGFRRLVEGRGLRSAPLYPIGLDPTGSLLLAGKVQGHWEDRLQNGVALKRVKSDGSLDRSFGHNGLATARFPRLVYSDEALDDRGRILVAMALRGPTRGRIFSGGLIGIALARLRTDGSLDRSFGRHGLFKVPFRGKREVRLQGIVAVDNGKALISARRECPTDCGTTLIQVDLGS